MKAAMLYLFAASAWAQTLTPVTAPAGSGIPWWAWPVGAAVLLLVGYLVIKRKSPTTAAAVSNTVSADIQSLTTAAHRVASAVEAHMHATAPAYTVSTTTTEPAAEPIPAAPAGKQGVAGVFSLTVTGDAKVDLPALTAAYYAV